MKYDPDYAVAYQERGHARIKAGDERRGLKDFDRAISLERNEAELYEDRGTAHQFREELGEAIADYTKALRLKPDELVSNLVEIPSRQFSSSGGDRLLGTHW